MTVLGCSPFSPTRKHTVLDEFICTRYALSILLFRNRHRRPDHDERIVCPDGDATSGHNATDRGLAASENAIGKRVRLLGEQFRSRRRTVNDSGGVASAPNVFERGARDRRDRPRARHILPAAADGTRPRYEGRPTRARESADPRDLRGRRTVADARRTLAVLGPFSLPARSERRITWSAATRRWRRDIRSRRRSPGPPAYGKDTIPRSEHVSVAAVELLTANTRFPRARREPVLRPSHEARPAAATAHGFAGSGSLTSRLRFSRFPAVFIPIGKAIAVVYQQRPPGRPTPVAPNTCSIASCAVLLI